MQLSFAPSLPSPDRHQADPYKSGSPYTRLPDTLRNYSRAELREYAQRLAHGLRNAAGLSPGDVICLFSPNTLYYHMTVIASQCGGLVFSGANAAYQPAELAHQLTDSSAKLVLVHPTVLDIALAATQQMGWSEQQQTAQIVIALRDDEAGPAAQRFKTLDYLLSSQKMEPHPVKDVKNTVAYLGYSSGTSGEDEDGIWSGRVDLLTPLFSILNREGEGCAHFGLQHDECALHP